LTLRKDGSYPSRVLSGGSATLEIIKEKLTQEE